MMRVKSSLSTNGHGGQGPGGPWGLGVPKLSPYSHDCAKPILRASGTWDPGGDRVEVPPQPCPPPPWHGALQPPEGGTGILTF